jgi:putative heme-binding domain-containing protein
MEDILDPNRNVDQAFRASTLALDDGRVVTGLVLRDPGEVVVLADSEGKEVSIAKKSIEERKVVPLSPMPANMSEQVNDADFCHLVEFLLSHREKPK